jgi:predicted small secreted protein
VNSKQIAPTTKIKIIKTMDELNKKIKGSWTMEDLQNKYEKALKILATE